MLIMDYKQLIYKLKQLPEQCPINALLAPYLLTKKRKNVENGPDNLSLEKIISSWFDRWNVVLLLEPLLTTLIILS